MKKEPSPFFVALCAAVAIVISLSAQESRPAPQFTIERPIVSGRGPHRLRVDVPLLVGTQPRTLNDLRLYNAGGVEIPRLMVWPPSPVVKWIGGRVAAIPTTAKTSGFSSVLAKGLGGAGYTAVPADYDGDGKADFAVYESATGTWCVLTSSSNYTGSMSRG